MMMGVGRKGKPKQGHAAASLHTTASDYAKYIVAMMNQTGLDKNTIDSLLTPQVISKPEITRDVAWGLGVGLQKTADGNSFWHWGDNYNYKCFFLAFPVQKIACLPAAPDAGHRY